ncbi:MAG: hypothetical protein ACTS6G_04215 [Candidatus Hodgkinia cicadicola]
MVQDTSQNELNKTAEIRLETSLASSFPSDSWGEKNKVRKVKREALETIFAS